ncbi:MAG: phosphate ABC transporter permease subunit PstC [Peptococcaceae bacterium]|nr:phosphate ABC transporter permease subunit PstC [Peptococcaceae bacterium]
MKKRLPVVDFFKGLTACLSLGLVLLIILMALVIWQHAGESVQKFGWKFIVSRQWNPVHDNFGALPYIYGTAVSTMLAILFAGPPSVGAAVYLAEFAPRRLKTLLSFVVDLLAAVPGIVYGLWGSFVLAPLLRNRIEPWLERNLGFMPFFQGPPFGLDMLAAGIILAVMSVPVITAVTREVLETVPHSQREPLIAMGATPWEVVRVGVMPYARDGIVGAFTLGLGRAIGETMAVTMVIGNEPRISASLFSPAHSMTSVIVNEFAQAIKNLHLSSLIHIGLLLFCLTLLVNILARLLIFQMTRREKKKDEYF